MAWVAKVRRHVVYLQQKTVGGNANYVKRRPAIITAFSAGDSAPILRVRHGGETYGNNSNGIGRKTHTNGNNQVAKYVTW